MKTAAPGKIIISGEHAVVYGKPALVMAIDRFSHCQIEIIDSEEIVLELPDLFFRQTKPIKDLNSIRERLDHQYQEFIRGGIAIDKVVTSPGDVFFYLLALLLQIKDELPGPGLWVRVSSQLVPGGGTGSSASTIVSVLFAAASLLQLDLTPDTLFSTSVNVENLLHGRSSGVDPYICLHGGFNRFQTGVARRIDVPEMTWHVAFSGKPEAGTGESVDRVRSEFGNSTIWNEFNEITRQLETAIAGRHPEAMISAVRENHRLLCRIGVVPETVKQYVKSIEARGGAAKVSGAGSVKGDGAGALLILGPKDAIEFSKSRYPVFQTSLEVSGVRIL